MILVVVDGIGSADGPLREDLLIGVTVDLWAAVHTEALGRIVALSLAVSLSATALATLLGTPFGAALAVCRVPGRRIIVIAVNALLGLPPVVVGLALYLLLSRSSPLGMLGLLFTPSAMV